MSLRWVRHTKATGLAAVAANPRGWYMKDTNTGINYMSVYPTDRTGDVWRFMVMTGSYPNRSSTNSWPTCEQALERAKAYWAIHKDEIIAARAAVDAERER